MLSHKILEVLKKHAPLNDFIRNIEDIEVLVKNLNKFDLERLSTEYPELLKLEKIKITETISCITFIKINPDGKNFDKIKKFKIYFNESNEKIIKILKN